nr:ACP phosphodiesterase [uncultured Desulfuromonas sp.]
MNYLLHALLSDDDPLIRAGNLLGDFVKGRLTQGRFPAKLLHGLQQHRQLDRFAHDHPVFCRSQERLDARFGRYRGIMIDLFYDHFTALDWNEYHPVSLEQFSQSLYHTLQHHQAILPKNFLPVLPRMVEKDWLTSYQDQAVMQRALVHVAGRIRHDNPLAEGYAELETHYQQLREDCRQFISDARHVFLDEKAP